MNSLADSEPTRARLQAAICLCILGGILRAGLWPIHAPRNQVIWLTGANGRRFGQHGTILSAGPFSMTDSQPDSPCSIEVWLQPDSISDGGTFLAFDDSASVATFPCTNRNPTSCLRVRLATQAPRSGTQGFILATSS